MFHMELEGKTVSKILLLWTKSKYFFKVKIYYELITVLKEKAT